MFITFFFFLILPDLGIKTPAMCNDDRQINSNNKSFLLEKVNALNAHKQPVISLD